MTGSGTTEKLHRQHIQELQKRIVMGDISGMAGSVATLQSEWSSLSESERQEVLKLEAIFLSMVEIETGRA